MTNQNNIKVLVPIAEGFEEVEAMAVVDILKRAGADVVLAGLGDEVITGRSGVKLIPDTNLKTALLKGPYDIIVLPGGLPNARILANSRELTDAIKKTEESGKMVAAICASPIALDKAGVLNDRKITSHPALKNELPSSLYVEDRVVVSNRVITSRGPGTAIEFAFAIVRELFGDAVTAKVNEDVLARL